MSTPVFGVYQGLSKFSANSFLNGVQPSFHTSLCSSARESENWKWLTCSTHTTQCKHASQGPIRFITLGRATVQKQARMIAFYLLQMQRQKLSGAFGCYAEIMREHSRPEQVNQRPICASSQTYRRLRLEMWRLMHICRASLLRQTCARFVSDCVCLLAAPS